MQRLTHPSTSTGRRIGVALLLVVLLAPMLSLWFYADGMAEAGLPACCRAHGKHHCTQGAGDDGTNLTHPVISERCPMQGAAPAAHPLAGVGERAYAPVAFTVARVVPARPCTTLLFRDSHDHPKRGPPTSGVCSHEA